METIGSFLNVKSQDFYFSGCGSCMGTCCNGAEGFALSPLILEDFAEVYQNFAIVFALAHDGLGAFVVLNDGSGHCRYYKEGMCTIYEQRTPACKLYPLSPYFDDLLIDTACPSVNLEYGQRISHKGHVAKEFVTKRLENFVHKRQKTQEFLDTIDKQRDLRAIGTILSVPLYIYEGKTQDPFLTMHQESVKYLKEFEGLQL